MSSTTKGIRLAVLTALLIAALAFLLLSDPQVFESLTGHSSFQSYLYSKRNELLLGEKAAFSGKISIPLNPMIELDFKSKEEILNIRKQMVFEHPDLTGPEYQPHPAIFGQIIDGKPWWGIHGIYFYGPGSKGIDGLSEESRILANPFLLAALIENRAWPTSLRPDRYSNYYPVPRDLWFNPQAKEAGVTYNLSSHFRHLTANRYYGAGDREIGLIAYNARDFGYNYLFFDMAHSKNISPIKGRGQLATIKQYIHMGKSCGYPTKCNNMSPAQPELDLRIPALPAKAVIKFWRQKPASVSDREDFLFTIIMH